MLAHPAENTAKFNIYKLHLDEEARGDLTLASVRDHDGYLWIATDNGLKRYDGYHLRVFSNNINDPSSLGISSLTSLFLQSTGVLWAAGVNLNRYHPDTETFTRYPVSDNTNILAIAEGRKGMLWIGGSGFGLRGFDVAQGKVIHKFFDKTTRGFITSITPHGSSASIWVASRDGLYLFNTETHQVEDYQIPINFKGGLGSIRSLMEDRHGNLWIAGQAGLHVLNPRTREIKQYLVSSAPGALKTNALWCVFEDSKGQIWIGTDKQGVHKYLPETDSFLHLPASSSDLNAFPPGSVQNIYEDSDGTLWFSISVYGMRRISHHLKKFTVFRHNDAIANSLGFNNVLDLHEDRNGMIWIATDGGGLDRYNPTTQTFTHFRHDSNNPHSISSDSILAIAEDPEGSIWIGTWAGGLDRFDPATETFTHMRADPNATKNQTLGNNNISRIHINAQGLMYLSVWRTGMQIYDPASNTFKSYSPFGAGKESGIKSVSINDFLLRPDGKYWIGGHSGLELFDPQSEKFTQTPLAGVESIYDLYLTVDNILWIATSKNLIRYDPKTHATKFYFTQDGLADNFVASIEEDSEGYLWLGTRHGLNRFNPRTEVFESFDESNGLAGSQFNRFSHLFTKNQKMYFGGASGLNFFDPLHLPKNTKAPQVHITSLELFQTTAIPGKSKWLKHNINTTKTLTLPYNLRDIAFGFTALNYISPFKNRYRYRLKGFNDEWIEVDSSRRRSRYTNLAPGKYIFQLHGSNNEGLWSTNTKEIELIILPAWWQTLWMKCLYAIFFIAALYIFNYGWLRIMRIRSSILKQRVYEKTTEINTQKTALEKANHAINKLNMQLEARVETRTRELSVEIEERKLAEKNLFHMAFHDLLTDLPNRAWLLDQLKILIHNALTDNVKFALFFLDGDRFKQVNDTHGHLLGDSLLKAAAQRLTDLLPDNAHAIRLGGDEFTIIMNNVTSEEQVKALAQKIITAFDAFFVLKKIQMNFRVSIGMVLCDKQYTQPAQILRDADIAMYRAKDLGRSTYQMFDSEMLKHTLEISKIEADLTLALERKQLFVVFQPIIILATGELSGFEVLLRWQHHEKGLIPPSKFIPIAEDLGIIYEIGLWVLEQACIQQTIWRKDIRDMPSISVNVSTLQLSQQGFIDSLDDIFQKTCADSGRIKLEITESTLMENIDTVNQLLEALRKREIELAIDDFGTGYSSLSYLDKLPVQVLKIDQSFVSKLTNNDEKSDGANEIVKATISLAHNLNIRVVAEGIEKQEQLDILSDYGCDYGQGMFISPPLSIADASEFLNHSKVASLKNIKLK